MIFGREVVVAEHGRGVCKVEGSAPQADLGDDGKILFLIFFSIYIIIFEGYMLVFCRRASFHSLVRSKASGAEEEKCGASAEYALPTNDANVLTGDLLPSKKWKRGRSGKERVSVPLVSETPGAADDEDPKNLAVRTMEWVRWCRKKWRRGI